MKEKVLISGFFSGISIMKALLSFSPSKLILVVEELKEKKDLEKAKEIKDNIEKVKNEFKGLVDIEVLFLTSQYELEKITKEIVEKIDSIKEKDILLNVTEGRRPISFGMMFAGYLRKEKVKKIFYITEETKEVVQLPIFEFSITDKQRKLLEKIRDKPVNAKESIKELKKDSSKSTVYQSIKELIGRGYITTTNEGDLKITDSGKIFFY